VLPQAEPGPPLEAALSGLASAFLRINVFENETIKTKETTKNAE
jgi:hypothetical protein